MLDRKDKISKKMYKIFQTGQDRSKSIRYKKVHNMSISTRKIIKYKIGQKVKNR